MKKKVILILIFILIVLILSGCFKNHYYDSDDYRGEVIAIQIIICKYDSRGQLLKNLDETIFDEFLEDLSKIRWVSPYGSPLVATGISFCIYFEDMSYDIICSNCTTVDGYFCNTLDDELYDDLLKKYYWYS